MPSISPGLGPKDGLNCTGRRWRSAAESVRLMDAPPIKPRPRAPLTAAPRRSSPARIFPASRSTVETARTSIRPARFCSHKSRAAFIVTATGPPPAFADTSPRQRSLHSARSSGPGAWSEGDGRTLVGRARRLARRTERRSPNMNCGRPVTGQSQTDRGPANAGNEVHKNGQEGGTPRSYRFAVPETHVLNEHASETSFESPPVSVSRHR
jgi:hypothetical protein